MREARYSRDTKHLVARLGKDKGAAMADQHINIGDVSVARLEESYGRRSRPICFCHLGMFLFEMITGPTRSLSSSSPRPTWR